MIMEIDKVSERFNQVSEKYDEQRKSFVPCYDDYYGTSIDFLSKLNKNFNYILDLGAGTGLLTKYLVDFFPDAKYTLVDVSEQMLDISRKRFTGKDNFEYLVYDYSKKIPQGKYDLIASALSIHHLEDKDKSFLYSNIHRHLNGNGYFINLDQFNASSEAMNDHYNEYWYNQINESKISTSEKASWLKRRDLDKENTIYETIDMLKESGFKNVECIYCYLKFGVILASN